MTPSKRVPFGFVVLSGVLSLQHFAACGSTVRGQPGLDTTAGSGGSGGTGPSTTAGGGGATGPSITAVSGLAATTTGSPPSADLFACFDLSCAPVCGDLSGLGTCGDASALACAEGVWRSGESGVVIQEHRPDRFYQSDFLFVLLGDGQALTQWRNRECRTSDNCDLEAKPWNVAAQQQRCDVGASFPYVLNCVTAEYSCDDVKDIVGGVGGAGGSAGGGGDAGRAGEAAE